MSHGKKRESILDLNKYMDKAIMVKFVGGRQVIGTLKGYDTMLNLVLDECKENLRDPLDRFTISEATRVLGLTVLRGTSVMTINPMDGSQEVANPFLQQPEPVI